MGAIFLKIFYVLIFILGLLLIPLVCFIENIINLWSESFFFKESKLRYSKSFSRIKSLIKK